MNIFSLLGGKSNQQQDQQQQQSNQQSSQQPNQQQQQMQSDPGNFPINKANDNPFAGLDVLSVLLDNNGQQQKSAPQFNIPRDKLSEIAKGLNFTQDIPQELMANLNPEILQALMPLLNHVGQQSYLNALEHNMQLSGKYLDSRFDFEREGLNSSVRQQSVTSNIQSIEKLHPMMQGMFRDAASKLAKEFPTATAKQIEEQVWSMFGQVTQNIDSNDPNKVQQRQASAPKEEDWDQAGGFVPPQQ